VQRLSFVGISGVAIVIAVVAGVDRDADANLRLIGLLAANEESVRQ
jgi:hypothetical protein